MQVPILVRIARGNPQAVDDCIARYGGLVWSLACRLSPSVEDAEDAAQEIFMDLWRNAWRFREDVGTEVGFVSTLARRRLIDRRRRASRCVKTFPMVESTTETTGPAPESPLELAEEGMRIKDCMRKLRDRERQAIELSVYSGLSQSNIATRLEAPLGTVKTLIRRGLMQLHHCMRSGHISPKEAVPR
ncbi:sigma-70 family RNA polymerase sigma factor [Singulisphaera rosea]